MKIFENWSTEAEARGSVKKSSDQKYLIKHHPLIELTFITRVIHNTHKR